MTLTAIHASALPKPRFLYSPCVKSGPFYQVSGLIALDPASGTLEPGGPGPETARILSNVSLALPQWGLTFDDLMIARIFTTRMDLFGEINASWYACFKAVTRPPARTSVGVVALPINASVEIEFCFYREQALSG